MKNTAENFEKTEACSQNGADFWRCFAIAALAVTAFIAGSCASKALTLLGFISREEGGWLSIFLFLCCFTFLVLLFKGICELLYAAFLPVNNGADPARRKRISKCVIWGLAWLTFPLSLAYLAKYTVNLEWSDVATGGLWLARIVAVICFLHADRSLRAIKQANTEATARLKHRAAIFLTTGVASLAIPALVQLWFEF